MLLRADDPLAQSDVVPLRKLDGWRLILLRDNPCFGQNFLEFAAKHGVALTAVHAAEDFPSMHWMVRAGLGVAPCSLLLREALPAGLVAKSVRPILSQVGDSRVMAGASSAASRGPLAEAARRTAGLRVPRV